MLIRVAAVQIDFNPAIFSGATNLLKKPIVIFDKKKQANGIAFLNFVDKGLSEKIKGFINDKIKEQYIELLRKKLCKIIEFCTKKNVDFIIFPEYSVPSECLVEIKNLSVKNGVNIIAGSHSVLTENLGIYQKIGLKKIYKKSLRKAICPIFHLNGDVEHIEKIIPSKLDCDIEEGEIWKIIEFGLSSINGKVKAERFLKAPIFLCMDFLKRDTILNKFVKDQEKSNKSLKKDYSFIILPTYTLETEDFVDIAKYCLRREKKPVIFVNASKKGGTRIFCHFDLVTKNQLNPILCDNDNTGTIGIPEGEEGIIIVDFDPDKQFTEQPTSVPHYEGSFLKGYYPFVYSYTLNDFENIIKEINSHDDYDEKKGILRKYETQVRDWCNYSKIYAKKIPILYDALDDLRNKDIDLYLGHLYLESDIDMMAQWRLKKIENTADFLYTILRDRRLTESERRSVFNSTEYYRKQELELKGNQLIDKRDELIHIYSRQKLPTETHQLDIDEMKKIKFDRRYINKSILWINNGLFSEDLLNNIRHLDDIKDDFDLLKITDRSADIILTFNKDEFNRYDIIILFINSDYNPFNDIKDKLRMFHNRSILVYEGDLITDKRRYKPIESFPEDIRIICKDKYILSKLKMGIKEILEGKTRQ